MIDLKYLEHKLALPFSVNDDWYSDVYPTWAHYKHLPKWVRWIEIHTWRRAQIKYYVWSKEQRRNRWNRRKGKALLFLMAWLLLGEQWRLKRWIEKRYMDAT